MSEIHAIMTGGFATMGGAIIAVYIAFGVSFQPSFYMISSDLRHFALLTVYVSSMTTINNA